VILSAILLAEVIYLIFGATLSGVIGGAVEPKQVGLALYGPYLIGVELASMLLLGALVGASHLGPPVPIQTEGRP
jgi:NADH-quinone oxidoreductase subunit J